VAKVLLKRGKRERKGFPDQKEAEKGRYELGPKKSLLELRTGKGAQWEIEKNKNLAGKNFLKRLRKRRDGIIQNNPEKRELAL